MWASNENFITNIAHCIRFPLPYKNLTTQFLPQILKKKLTKTKAREIHSLLLDRNYLNVSSAPADSRVDVSGDKQRWRTLSVWPVSSAIYKTCDLINDLYRVWSFITRISGGLSLLSKNHAWGFKNFIKDLCRFYHCNQRSIQVWSFITRIYSSFIVYINDLCMFYQFN